MWCQNYLGEKDCVNPVSGASFIRPFDPKDDKHFTQQILNQIMVSLWEHNLTPNLLRNRRERERNGGKGRFCPSVRNAMPILRCRMNRCQLKKGGREGGGLAVKRGNKVERGPIEHSKWLHQTPTPRGCLLQLAVSLCFFHCLLCSIKGREIIAQPFIRFWEKFNQEVVHNPMCMTNN